MHVAVNCASVSCPPLAVDPYRADALDGQLQAAAKRYLGSPLGLTVSGDTLSVSSVFKWYGDDFVERYSPHGPGSGAPADRAVLGLIATLGPAPAAAVAASGRAQHPVPRLRLGAQ